ncbi:MAG TPA: hypothetical protein VHD83_04400 [Puia sp.]|nr:hypothetical protein [Puia sp.]
MKKIMTILIAGFILWLSALPAVAQKAHKTPSWVPAKGYWVIESRNDSSIAYFYSDSHQLMYKEQLDGTPDVDRRRTKLRLKRALRQVVTAWEKDHILQGNRQLLAGLARKSIGRQNPSIYRQMMNGDTSTAGQP